MGQSWVFLGNNFISAATITLFSGDLFCKINSFEPIIPLKSVLDFFYGDHILACFVFLVIQSVILNLFHSKLNFDSLFYYFTHSALYFCFLFAIVQSVLFLFGAPLNFLFFPAVAFFKYIFSNKQSPSITSSPLIPDYYQALFFALVITSLICMDLSFHKFNLRSFLDITSFDYYKIEPKHFFLNTIMVNNVPQYHAIFTLFCVFLSSVTISLDWSAKWQYFPINSFFALMIAQWAFLVYNVLKMLFQKENITTNVEKQKKE